LEEINARFGDKVEVEIKDTFAHESNRTDLSGNVKTSKSE
jgi:hypothetical protein